MEIAFFGTSDKSQPILESLHNNFDLTLCVTKSDTKVGRKQEIRETAVKQWAKAHNISYITTSNIKEDVDKVIETLQKHEIELIIMADFSFITPESILNTPKYRTINIHFSLLPLLRGACPVPYAILKRHELTGVTYYLMDRGMDTGDILEQSIYILNGTETATTLYNKLFGIAAEDTPTVIDNYVRGKIAPQEQDSSQATYCYSKTRPKSTLIDKNDAKIDWNSPIEEIEAMVRAFNPWPIAWTTLGELGAKKNPELRVKIFESEIVGGKLEIKQLQVAGKNKTDWESFKNGYLAS